MTDERTSFTNNITMYNIINKRKNNKTLYTVVFVTHHLSLPLCQSYDYDKCLKYISSYINGINDKSLCDNMS